MNNYIKFIFCIIIDRISNFHEEPSAKYRRNIELVAQHGWSKRSVNAALEADVTDGRKLIKKQHMGTTGVTAIGMK